MTVGLEIVPYIILWIIILVALYFIKHHQICLSSSELNSTRNQILTLEQQIMNERERQRGIEEVYNYQPRNSTTTSILTIESEVQSATDLPPSYEVISPPAYDQCSKPDLPPKI